jgi:hypothetical protein
MRGIGHYKRATARCRSVKCWAVNYITRFSFAALDFIHVRGKMEVPSKRFPRTWPPSLVAR